MLLFGKIGVFVVFVIGFTGCCCLTTGCCCCCFGGGCGLLFEFEPPPIFANFMNLYIKNKKIIIIFIFYTKINEFYKNSFDHIDL